MASCAKCVGDTPLLIKKVILSDRTFNLVQETQLPAGTKQRGISYFYRLKASGVKEVITYGTVYGYGQVATAWCCKEVGLCCTIFLPQTFPRTKMTKLAIKLGANVIDVPPDHNYPTTNVLANQARIYANKCPDGRLIPLGLDDKDYIQCLAEGIGRVSHGINPKRIWLAGGSGVLARALSIVFPEAELHIVQVGRKLYTDVLAGLKHKLYISPESFRRNAEIVPPYTSLRHYDAKVWRFASEFGQDGDYIWNVK
jgi:hypothetical protein